MFKCIWDMGWWRIAVERAACRRSKLVLGDCSGCAGLSLISCLQMATDHSCNSGGGSLVLTSGYFRSAWLFLFLCGMKASLPEDALNMVQVKGREVILAEGCFAVSA